MSTRTSPIPANAAAETIVCGPRRCTHVAAFTSVSEVRSAWDALLAAVPASAYQTPDWLLPWLATIGRDTAPLFVLGSDPLGPVALLALDRTRHGGVVVARFGGMPDSNFGLGLFHPGLDWTSALLRDFLAEAARLGHIDLFWLANQPFSFAGRPNPLERLPHRLSPSLQHEAVLDGVPGKALDHLASAKTRKHIRQKETKLASLGPVRHVIATDTATAERIATAMVNQRAARFGATARDADLEAYLHAAALPGPDGRPGLQLHALFCGDTIVSAFAGASHGDRTSGMMVSYASEPAWARFSPGELLIARVIAAASRAGMRAFDLGIGEARYKAGFCPVAVPLFDTVLGVTRRGRLVAGVLVFALGAKRHIKRDPRLWRIVERWRRRLRRG